MPYHPVLELNQQSVCFERAWALSKAKLSYTKMTEQSSYDIGISPTGDPVKLCFVFVYMSHGVASVATVFGFCIHRCILALIVSLIISCLDIGSLFSSILVKDLDPTCVYVCSIVTPSTLILHLHLHLQLHLHLPL